MPNQSQARRAAEASESWHGIHPLRPQAVRAQGKCVFSALHTRGQGRRLMVAGRSSIDGAPTLGPECGSGDRGGGGLLPGDFRPLIEPAGTMTGHALPCPDQLDGDRAHKKIDSTSELAPCAVSMGRSDVHCGGRPWVPAQCCAHKLLARGGDAGGCCVVADGAVT
jgi:hypothetical protein